MTLLEELCVSQEPAQNTVPPVKQNDVCWVARTVYGEENPRWMLFREWLVSDAPPWFRGLYVRRGESFALWIAPHKRIKSVIRRWMDSVIARRD